MKSRKFLILPRGLLCCIRASFWRWTPRPVFSVRAIPLSNNSLLATLRGHSHPHDALARRHQEGTMKRFNLEVAVGLFVVLGLCALAYLSVRLGQLQLGQGNTYDLIAVFLTVGGLRAGANVEIAGVEVGRVQDIKLDNYAGGGILRIDKHVQLQEDAIASIRTRGLIGEKYVRVTPGGSDHLLSAGSRLREVEPPIDIETLIGQYIQGKL